MSGGFTGAPRRASAQNNRCSCDCCTTARRREYVQAACISTAASLGAIVVASLIYGAGKAFL